MLMLGKELIDSTVIALNSIDNSNFPTAYDKYFKIAHHKGLFTITVIGGGGGGIGEPFGSNTQYGRYGEHGDFYQGNLWVDVNTLDEDGSFRWFYIGAGGASSDYPNSPSNGGNSRIVSSGGFLVSKSGGDAASTSPSTSSSVTDSGTSPWTAAGLSGEYGRGGDGARWGGGRVAESGIVGRITVKRIM